MKHGLLVFTALSLLLAASSFSQAPAAPTLSDFAGTWKAAFHKQTWLTLTLVDTKTLTDSRYPGEILTGTLIHSTEISADDEGDLTKVGDEMSSDKIVSVDLRGETLHIETRDEEGSVDRYKLVLTGSDTAELQPVVENRASAPKAFKLKRNPLPQK